MKFNTNRQGFLQIFIMICFTSVISLSYGQTFNPNLHMEYNDNLLTLSAQKADLKNVLLNLSNQTGIYVKFPKSLKKQITTEISGVSLSHALPKILKGMNHVIIYSGSRKNRAVVSEVFVYMKSKGYRASSPSTPRQKQIEARIRSYERRLELLNQKLSKIDNDSRQGKRYLRQIRSYKNIVENLKRKVR